ncbi:hypothetical protein BO83DRAFT_427504 [Aspergillus eucalypticola CBS 122712]|uniref:Uncharacterized protein n=1 Tax=Aspergillus eucalypticola (strain CBS 122712 / IBT 29274) TaxID=1448314 RepID=A0A317VFZ4_ASPEC|nr:uncharacterized protein BO83DRAFT_427504 [Aspergillus eucalypticola CBS 122712]PWY71842.1 hypothetical protein BO83DRAFT_427504 [Aspergillus eucalypticola CBS 122712]
MNDDHQTSAQPNTLKRALSQSTTSSTSSTTTNSHATKARHHKASRLSSVKQFLRSRSHSPTAASIPSNRSSPSASFDIPRSIPANSTPRRSASPVSTMSPSRASTDDSATNKRVHSTHIRRSGHDYRRYSGTVNHYGRHSNDWLFGGFSLRDTVRDGVDRLRHHHAKD